MFRAGNTVRCRTTVGRRVGERGDGPEVPLTVEGVEVSPDHWIGGQRVGSSEAFADISPIDEDVIARVARGDAREANAAVAAARRAFDTWGRTSPEERARILHAVGEGIEARVLELAAVETRDNGSTLRSMRDSVIFKPPEWAPLTASMLAEIAQRAGLPDGVLNVVQGIGEEVGAALVAHP